MDVDLPLNSWHHGTDKNQTVWALPDHTEAKPSLMMFKRRPHNGDTYGYQIKVVQSHEHAVTGLLKNQIIECNFRNVDFQDSTTAFNLFSTLRTALASAGLGDAVTKTGELPDGAI